MDSVRAKTVRLQRRKTGLGFSIKGGIEHGIPVVVSDVEKGGSAGKTFPIIWSVTDRLTLPPCSWTAPSRRRAYISEWGVSAWPQPCKRGSATTLVWSKCGSESETKPAIRRCCPMPVVL